jgi:hypothetical protein
MPWSIEMGKMLWNWLLSHYGMGLFIGWIVGVVWWIGLMAAFNDSHEPLSGYGFLAGIPWAVFGLLVGAANAQFRGYWVPATAALGTVGGGIYSIETELFDGWLSIIMPIECLSGTLMGLIVGLFTRGTWGWFKGWEDSL